ncbi:GNAT family N-acetyltransferase [Clostridium sp. 'deep sea']|uniref:GNAT family N-acetyltransferase n=1 Tax=Clostridium sp. 'deep sea' TaxID=2779445 RepID=UPI00189681E8|nr:GNAT family N-acetyltransferase [Clostridium sp. 'deep sea']QOR35949.1 GNAT family N-acetyltransferase [Clostridium sp. 'deep sea']
MHYRICNKYTVTEADPQEFATYYVIYGHGNKNIWFPTKVENAIEVFSKIKKHYFISYDGTRVGGFIKKKNWFGFVFLIPPFNKEISVVKGIVELIKETAKSSTITVSGIYPASYHNYQRLGFQRTETERIMIKPTSQYYIKWSNDLIIEAPNESNRDQLTKLYYEVYKNSPVKCIADQQLNFYDDLLKEHVKIVEPKYSTVLRDKNTNDIIACCLVFIWQNLPYIADLVVKEDYQQKGLGSMMIKKALNNAYGKYLAIRLAVKAGNRAEGLYYKLGFTSGIESSEFVLNI